MELHQVRYFLAVCAAENFTRAAKAVHVAQPSLTKAIRKLEDDLGGPLFHRERNRTTLTALGHRVRPHLEALYAASETAKLDAADFLSDDRATVRLGVMSTIAPTRMTGFLARLRDDLPALDLQIHEAPASALVEQLEADSIDVALLGLPDLPDHIRLLPLYAERYVIAFPAGHALERGNAVTLADLDGVDYMKRVHCEFVGHYEALAGACPLSVRVRYSSEREDWVQAMVAAGLGCSIMPEFLPVLDGIGTRPLTGPEVTRTIALATIAGRPHGAALAALMRLAQRYPWPGRGAGD